MRVYRRHILAWVIVFLTGICLGGCHDWPDTDVVSVSPMWGRWTLASVNGQTIAADSRTRYTFERDDSQPALNSGVGTFERYDVRTGQWSGTPIEWEVMTENELVIAGSDGAGTFEYLLSAGTVRTELRLYDASTQTEQLFYKWVE